MEYTNFIVNPVNSLMNCAHSLWSRWLNLALSKLLVDFSLEMLQSVFMSQYLLSTELYLENR